MMRFHFILREGQKPSFILGVPLDHYCSDIYKSLERTISNDAVIYKDGVPLERGTKLSECFGVSYGDAVIDLTAPILTVLPYSMA